jgi:hypothetical protein
MQRASDSNFEQWLARELGGGLPSDLALGYLERRECKDGDVIDRQGDPADSIDFIAAGTLAIVRSCIHMRAKSLHPQGEFDRIREIQQLRTICLASFVAHIRYL